MSEFVAASAFAATTLQIALVQTLVRKGILTAADEVREIMEGALLMLEGSQSQSANHADAIKMARDMLEQSLPTLSAGRTTS